MKLQLQLSLCMKIGIVGRDWAKMEKKGRRKSSGTRVEARGVLSVGMVLKLHNTKFVPPGQSCGEHEGILWHLHSRTICAKCHCPAKAIELCSIRPGQPKYIYI